MNFTYKNYDCSLNQLTKQLQEKGVAVIPNVLDIDEINNMKSGFWDTLEYLTKNFTIPVDRNNSNTWKSWYYLHPIHYMLMQHYSIGHSQFFWDLRQNPKVVDVFSKIF